jgi:hypothetical protein
VLKLLDHNESIERAGNLEIIGSPNKARRSPTEGKRYIASLHLDLKKRYRAKILSSLGLQKREDGRSGGVNYGCSGGSVVHLSKPKKKVLPIIKDVAINKVTSSWQDCKSIPAKPQPNQFHNPYSQYDEDFIIGYPTCRNQRVLQYHRKFRGPD